MLKTTVQEVDRTFLVYNATDPYDDAAATVFIILHKNGFDADATFRSKDQWRLSGPALLVFPNAIDRKWVCEHEGEPNSDLNFLRELLENIRTERSLGRSKIYVLFGRDHECFVSNLCAAFPDLYWIRYQAESANKSVIPSSNKKVRGRYSRGAGQRFTNSNRQ